MLYYRFRPSGELALKELLYDEVFLTSAVECNDPYDGMAFLAFGPERAMWQRLINLAWSKVGLPEKARLITGLVDHIVKDCPLSYADAAKYNYEKVIAELFPQGASIAGALAACITSLLDLYRPRPPYFASFSQSGESTLMWSHYASMHQGHCLIFRDLDGYLNQCHRRRKKSIERSTSKGLAPRMSSGIPERFQFKEVSYEEETSSLDAFACLPELVYGKKLSESERIELLESQQKQALTKHLGWSYEREVRITYGPGPSWLFGESLELTQNERLFHFRPTQLVGVILGARMSTHQKSRIREISQARLDRIAVDIGKHGVAEPFFDFVIFQAGLFNDRRDLSIEPIEVLSLGHRYGREDASFAKQVERWQQGWALVFEGSEARQQQFP